MMKKNLLLTTAMVLGIVMASQAQVSKGFRAGTSISNWRGDAAGTMNDLVDVTSGFLQTASKTGFYAGAYVQIPLSEKIMVEPGVYYAQKGYSLKGDLAIDKLNFLGAGASAKVNAHYIDIPVVLKVEPVKELQLFAGPQVSVLAKTDLRLQAGILGISLLNKTLDITNEFNRIDMGATAGVGYQFGKGVNITASYERGFSRLDKNETFKAYNQAVKVGLGFSF
jgi:Outer membrane protein beta-barrel domain